MTETYTGPTPAENIDDADLESARLEREADILLREGEARSFGPKPIPEAVREDAAAVRDWGRTRAEGMRRAVEDEPMRATLYALGLGVVIGLLVAR